MSAITLPATTTDVAAELAKYALDAPATAAARFALHHDTIVNAALAAVAAGVADQFISVRDRGEGWRALVTIEGGAVTHVTLKFDRDSLSWSPFFNGGAPALATLIEAALATA